MSPIAEIRIVKNAQNLEIWDPRIAHSTQARQKFNKIASTRSQDMAAQF